MALETTAAISCPRFSKLATSRTDRHYARVTNDEDDLADAEAREVFRYLAFPFPGDKFPPNLGAVVAGSVLSGERPALEVVHAPDGSWAVGDGVSDPNKAARVPSGT